MSSNRLREALAMFERYLFLKRNRLKKKGKFYKQVFLLSFDLTSLFYALLVVGYVFVAIFLEENVQGFFHHLIGLIEGFSANRLWQIITALPLIYLFRAFQQPGVLFTTAEHTLTVLPHTVRQVWTMAAAERWLKAFVAIVVAGTFYYIFSPTSWPLILAYVIILTGINMLMTIPEWKFFQLHLFLKMLIVFGLLLLNTMHFVIDSAAVGIIAIVLLVMINLLLLPRVFEKIDWKKVTAACDFKLWNMLIVSQATKIKFRKERSEEHTSELQSRFDLVCRLLLEKKKKKKNKLNKK